MGGTNCPIVEEAKKEVDAATTPEQCISIIERARYIVRLAQEKIDRLLTK